MRLIYNMTALWEQSSDPIISNKHIKTKIATCYIMLHHVTLHVTLRLLYFIIALDHIRVPHLFAHFPGCYGKTRKLSILMPSLHLQLDPVRCNSLGI